MNDEHFAGSFLSCRSPTDIPAQGRTKAVALFANIMWPPYVLYNEINTSETKQQRFFNNGEIFLYRQKQKQRRRKQEWRNQNLLK